MDINSLFASTPKISKKIGDVSIYEVSSEKISEINQLKANPKNQNLAGLEPLIVLTDFNFDNLTEFQIQTLRINPPPHFIEIISEVIQNIKEFNIKINSANEELRHEESEEDYEPPKIFHNKKKVDLNENITREQFGAITIYSVNAYNGMKLNRFLLNKWHYFQENSGSEFVDLLDIADKTYLLSIMTDIEKHFSTEEIIANVLGDNKDCVDAINYIVENIIIDFMRRSTNAIKKVEPQTIINGLEKMLNNKNYTDEQKKIIQKLYDEQLEVLESTKEESDGNIEEVDDKIEEE